MTIAIDDIRSGLARAAWSIGRDADKTSITLHFNGPPVAGAGDPLQERAQLRADAQYHIDKNWAVPPAVQRGDGIMYHGAVLADGTRLQLRDWDAILWHCANAQGNRHSIALHLPLGTGQPPTPAQWASFTSWCDELIAAHGMAGRTVVYGHREWKKVNAAGVQVPNSWCPGDLLFAMLETWRGKLRFKVIDPTGANIRQGPAITFPLAPVAGWESLGTIVTADKVLDVGGSVAPRWVHLADGRGFISLKVLEAV